MADGLMLRIPADLATQLLRVLNAGGLGEQEAVALAGAFARYNPPPDVAFGPLGDALLSANDPTAHHGGTADVQIEH